MAAIFLAQNVLDRDERRNRDRSSLADIPETNFHINYILGMEEFGIIFTILYHSCKTKFSNNIIIAYLVIQSSPL